MRAAVATLAVFLLPAAGIGSRPKAMTDEAAAEEAAAESWRTPMGLTERWRHRDEAGPPPDTIHHGRAATWLTCLAGLPDHGRALTTAWAYQARRMFYFGYENYMEHAFPLDELNPHACSGRGVDYGDHTNININDVLGNFSVGLIDSLDTLALMRNRSEFGRAVRLVVEHVSFAQNSTVQLFETTIRVLGGLVRPLARARRPCLFRLLPAEHVVTVFGGSSRRMSSQSPRLSSPILAERHCPATVESCSGSPPTSAAGCCRPSPTRPPASRIRESTSPGACS